jgi:methionine biosynthesis protein MetW
MGTSPDAPDAAALAAARAFAYENAREEVQAMVPAGRRRVLDLGCSSGALGAALKTRDGCEVVGVEVDGAYATRARERLDRVIEGDLEALAAQDGLQEDLGRFDCLIAADVLEHLRDPWTVLARMASLVGPGDPVVVSLPNVRFWETFWAIGRWGTFPRASQGLFDRTHLRWFTLADAIGLLDQAGIEHEATHRVMRLGRHYHATRDRRARALAHTPLRSFFTYQHVLRGTRR